MRNQASAYFPNVLPSTALSVATSKDQDNDKDTESFPVSFIPTNDSILYNSQNDIVLVLSKYHMNLSGDKDFRVIKNDKKATGRHIAICQLQYVHNMEITQCNEAQKGSMGFIP